MHSNSDRTLADFIDTFIQDPQFRKISDQLNVFNPFKVLRVERYELRHTNTLAWLLDQHGSHQLGTAFLQSFLAQISPDMVLSASAPLVEIRTELQIGNNGALIANDDPDLSNKGSGGDRLDILLEGRHPDGQAWAIAIEAKIDSKEGDLQLARYDASLAKHFAPDVAISKFYLTTAPVEAISSAHWTNILWSKHVLIALDSVLARPGLEQRVRDFLSDYQGVIASLSGQRGSEAEHIAALANQSDVAPHLRTLAGRIKEKKTVHSWDSEPWAASYRRNRVALDACMDAVLKAGAELVWNMVLKHFAPAQGWEMITGKEKQTLAVRFVPSAWAEVPDIKTPDNQWNLFYHAEFRNKQRDIEMKLYAARSGNKEQQKNLMVRLFGPQLNPRPDFQLNPSRKTLEEFMGPKGFSIKLYSQTIQWTEEQNGSLALGDQLSAAIGQFEQAVKLHSEGILQAQR